MLRVTLVACILALGMVSCRGAAEQPGPSNSGTPMAEGSAGSGPFTHTAEPPEEVPRVLLYREGDRFAVGDLVYSSWIVDGARQEREASDLSQLVPVIPRSDDFFELKVDSRVGPAFAFLLKYTSVGENGIPVDQGLRELCSDTNDRDAACTWESNADGGTIIRAAYDPTVTLLVLNLAWYVPFSSRGDGDLPSEVSASWAFSIRKRER
jgi:hypothetical protein